MAAEDAGSSWAGGRAAGSTGLTGRGKTLEWILPAMEATAGL